MAAAVFVDFPKNKCNFLHKNKLNIVLQSNSAQGGALWGDFLPGEVATIAPRQSAAPM